MLRGPATGTSLCDEHPYYTMLLIRQILDPIFDSDDHNCKETQCLMQNFSHPRFSWEVDIDLFQFSNECRQAFIELTNRFSFENRIAYFDQIERFFDKLH